MIEINPQKVVHVIFQSRRERGGDGPLRAFIEGLNEDEQAHLTAVAWVGRGAFEASDYADAVATAFTEKSVPTADYLMGMPHLSENLEAGLEAMGIDVTDVEEDFL
ncbi:MAG: DUF3775 domain-containing protein [Alkalilacustris sp.]